MKVHDFGDTDTAYRYRVQIPHSNKTPLTELIEWLKENRIRCNIMPGCAYFHNERDVVHCFRCCKTKKHIPIFSIM